MAQLSNLIALRQRKIELVQSAKAIMALGDEEHRELTAAEAKNFEKIQAALQDKEREIIAEEQRIAHD